MIWSLQVLRFVAAAMVVYIHAAQVAIGTTGSAGMVPHSIAGLGLAGVDIFFVISGVVIGKTAPGMAPIQFAWRRVRRVIPFYYLCCIPALFVALFSTGITWRDFLSSFVLWPATDVITPPLLAVAWTLSFEMLFYASAALVLMDRRWLKVLLCLYVVSFAARSVGPLFQFLGNPLILEFLFGVAIGRLPSHRAGIFCLPFGMGLLICAGLFHLAPVGGTIDFLRGDDYVRPFAIGLPAALIVYGTMQWQASESFWTVLGDASYAIYLSHPLVVTPLFVIWMMYPVQPDLIVAITFAVGILFGWRIHVLFEKPILAWLPRQWDDMRFRNAAPRATRALPTANPEGQPVLPKPPDRTSSRDD